MRKLLAQELTAATAAEIALLNNRSLQAAFENLGIAQAEVVQASRLANPLLVGAPRFSDRSGTNLDLGITQNLLQLLVRPARKQLAAMQLEETQLRVADEVGRSEVELRAAREHLTRMLGLWGDDVRWTVADRLPDLPAEEPPLRRLESLAIARRLDLAAESQSVEVTALALGITRDWRYLLTAEIGVSAERETDGEWLLGPVLALELPIFDHRQAEIAGHQARLRQRVAEMTALAVEIRSEVRTLRDRLLMTRDLLEHYRRDPLRERIVSRSSRAEFLEELFHRKIPAILLIGSFPTRIDDESFTSELLPKLFEGDLSRSTSALTSLLAIASRSSWRAASVSS